MKIAVTSKNQLKIEAVSKAYQSIACSQVIGYSTDSGVGEQPVNEQTLAGARNRIKDLASRTEGLDRIVSIENGIFREDGQWLDKAVVVLYNPALDQEYVAYSEPVRFPEQYVQRAYEIGLEQITVGQVMEEAGYVADRKDPHQSITGTSRKDYLEKTVQELVRRSER